MLNGALQDFTFAARLQGGQILSTQFFLPPTPNVTYSECLVAQIEEMILTGKAPYPVERTQIATAMLDRLLDSKLENHRRIETPDLKIQYHGPRESHFGGYAPGRGKVCIFPVDKRILKLFRSACAAGAADLFFGALNSRLLSV